MRPPLELFRKLSAAVVAGSALAILASPQAFGLTGVEGGFTEGENGAPAERVETVTVTKTSGAQPRSILALSGNKLPDCAVGDKLKVSADFELTNDCTTSAYPNCVGSPYTYDPKLDATLILGSSQNETGGAGAIKLDDLPTRTCHQQQPSREHHCVLAFSKGNVTRTLTANDFSTLPCLSSGTCSVNVVVSAWNANAAANGSHRVLVGQDNPPVNGQPVVGQNKAKLSVIRIRPSITPDPCCNWFSDPDDERVESLPLNDQNANNPVSKVVYSQKINSDSPGNDRSTLEAGDLIAGYADARTSVAPLANGTNALISSQMIVASGPNIKEIGDNDPYIGIFLEGNKLSAKNGFNCTHANYFDLGAEKCRTAKAGLASIDKDQDLPEDKDVYVNLVMTATAKIGSPRPNDKVDVLTSGFMSVDVYSGLDSTP